MKTMRTKTAVTATLALLGLGTAAALGADANTSYANSPTMGAPALSDQSASIPSGEKTFEGTVTSVNPQEKTFAVKSMLFTRTFNAGRDCNLSLRAKPGAPVTWAQLKPGVDVQVTYRDFDGVLVARDVSEHEMTYSGHISAIDLAAGKIEIKHGLLSRSFVLPADTQVCIEGTRTAGLQNLQLGDSVNVMYETVNGSHMAKRIEESGKQFLGTIQAMDTPAKAIEVRELKGNGGPEKWFNLADSCSIVINGKLDSSLRNLHQGETVSIRYNNDDGILVASRITPESARSVAQNTTASPQLHAYNDTPR